jgi:hypothetical protein
MTEKTIIRPVLLEIGNRVDIAVERRQPTYMYNGRANKEIRIVIRRNQGIF